MSLWIAWWDAIWLLRPAFSRLRAFMWFAITVAGLTVRTCERRSESERPEMTASIRDAKRFLFCRTVQCLLSTSSMAVSVRRKEPKGECRRTRRGLFQEG